MSSGFDRLRQRAFRHDSSIEERLVVAAISFAGRRIGMVIGEEPAEDGQQCDNGPAAKAHG